eukprot:332149-Prymnesium_polylepis.1
MRAAGAVGAPAVRARGCRGSRQTRRRAGTERIAPLCPCGRHGAASGGITAKPIRGGHETICVGPTERKPRSGQLRLDVPITAFRHVAQVELPARVRDLNRLAEALRS